MPNDDSYRSGILAGRLEALESRFSKHEDYMGDQLRTLNESVNKLREIVAQSAGSNRTFMAFLMLGGSLASGLIVHYLK